MLNISRYLECWKLSTGLTRPEQELPELNAPRGLKQTCLCPRLRGLRGRRLTVQHQASGKMCLGCEFLSSSIRATPEGDAIHHIGFFLKIMIISIFWQLAAKCLEQGHLGQICKVAFEASGRAAKHHRGSKAGTLESGPSSNPRFAISRRCDVEEAPCTP